MTTSKKIRSLKEEIEHDDLSPIENIRSVDRKTLFTRRSAILTAFGFSVAACTETVTSFSQGIRTILAEKNNAPVSRVDVASIPYATMLAKIGKESLRKITLGRVDEDEKYWYSANKTVIVTRSGRVIKTAGLPKNLIKTRFLGTDPLVNISKLQIKKTENGKSARRLVDMAPPDNYGVVIDSVIESAGAREIEIAELRFDTELFVERCRAATLDWAFENQFWVDRKDGIVWKSIQHIHPDLPALELQLLRPYKA